MIIEYKLIYEDNQASFKERVEKYLNEGWQMVGWPQVHRSKESTSGTWYYVSMTKGKTNEA